MYRKAAFAQRCIDSCWRIGKCQLRHMVFYALYIVLNIYKLHALENQQNKTKEYTLCANILKKSTPMVGTRFGIFGGLHYP